MDNKVDAQLYKKEVDNYKMVVEKLTEQFITLDFKKAADAAGCPYDEDQNKIYLDYFGHTLTIDCKTGQVSPQSESYYLSGEGITIMNYFNRYHMYAGVPMTGQLVSLMEVPGGGQQFFPAFKKLALEPLAEAFGNDPKRIYKTIDLLKGKKNTMGDASVTLNAFPHFPITLVIFEGDDEFPANASILYDKSASAYAHIEDVITLGVIAVQKVIQACS